MVFSIDRFFCEVDRNKGNFSTSLKSLLEKDPYPYTSRSFYRLSQQYLYDPHTFPCTVEGSRHLAEELPAHPEHLTQRSKERGPCPCTAIGGVPHTVTGTRCGGDAPGVPRCSATGADANPTHGEVAAQDERNNVCFDGFDNSFKSIVPEPSREKATPLLQTGTASLCEVIETCGNNI